MTYLNPDFEEKIKNLPESLQKAIWDLNLHQKMLKIWDKYQLLISEGNELYEEVQDVLAGEHKANDFFDNISRRLPDLESEMKVKIVAEVDEEIFQPIKQDLMKLEGTKAENLNNLGLKKEETAEDHVNLNKEEILSGLENPVLSSPLSEPVKQEETLVKKTRDELEDEKEIEEIMDSVVNNPALEAGAENGNPTTEKDIGGVSASPDISLAAEKKIPFGDLEKKNEVLRNSSDVISTKLTEVVKSPKQVQEIKTAPTQEVKKSAPDPYREPTN